MDVTLTNYMKIKNEKVLNYQVVEIINQVKKHNGTLNLIWHNNSYYDYSFTQYKNLLNDIIEEIKN